MYFDSIFLMFLIVLFGCVDAQGSTEELFNSSTKVTDLPPELLKKILRNLDPDDKRDVTRVSLVSSDFKKAAEDLEKETYQHFGNETHYLSDSKWCGAFNQKPKRSEYIKTMHITQGLFEECGFIKRNLSSLERLMIRLDQELPKGEISGLMKDKPQLPAYFKDELEFTEDEVIPEGFLSFYERNLLRQFPPQNHPWSVNPWINYWLQLNSTFPAVKELNIVDMIGSGVLHHAIIDERLSNRTDLIKSILETGKVIVNGRNSLGQSAVHFCFAPVLLFKPIHYFLPIEDCLDLLKENGAYLKVLDKFGLSPAYYAANLPLSEPIIYLHRQGVALQRYRNAISRNLMARLHTILKLGSSTVLDFNTEVVFHDFLAQGSDALRISLNHRLFLGMSFLPYISFLSENAELKFKARRAFWDAVYQFNEKQRNLPKYFILSSDTGLTLLNTEGPELRESILRQSPTFIKFLFQLSNEKTFQHLRQHHLNELVTFAAENDMTPVVPKLIPFIRKTSLFYSKMFDIYGLQSKDKRSAELFDLFIASQRINHFIPSHFSTWPTTVTTETKPRIVSRMIKQLGNILLETMDYGTHLESVKNLLHWALVHVQTSSIVTKQVVTFALDIMEATDYPWETLDDHLTLMMVIYKLKNAELMIRAKKRIPATLLNKFQDPMINEQGLAPYPEHKSYVANIILNAVRRDSIGEYYIKYSPWLIQYDFSILSVP